MKEQIRELADRLWRVHPSDLDAMGLKTRTDFYEHELKQFARMIVKECLNKVNEVVYSREMSGRYYPESDGNKILKQFGVEE